MTTSKAMWLQKAALRIASQSGEGLDMNLAKGRERSGGWKLPDGAVRRGDRVVIVGAVSSGLWVAAAAAAGREGMVQVFESEARYLEQTMAQVNQVHEELGYVNWRFELTDLADLRTNPEFIRFRLAKQAVTDLSGYESFRSELEQQRREDPLVADESVDVVLIDSGVNRLPADQAKQALAEAFRVLRRGGRLLLTAFLADETPQRLPPLGNVLSPQLVPREPEVVTLLNVAGFYGMHYMWRAELPTKVLDSVEFRAFAIGAFKGKQGVCLDLGHAVVYKGPWSEAYDDDGHRYVRGERTAVCEKTYAILTREPYAAEFIGIPCYLEVPAEQAPLFDCNTPHLRDPRVTKGIKTVFDDRNNGNSCCSPSEGCSC
jgi:arsenite methyltransferase